ncbi:MAG: hypothetical protein HRT57_13045 [Crocinitomicaceae bacterium]|nr:hypothetical protein [Crocinitomicaceae bacterium]
MVKAKNKTLIRYIQVYSAATVAMNMVIVIREILELKEPNHPIRFLKTNKIPAENIAKGDIIKMSTNLTSTIIVKGKDE